MNVRLVAFRKKEISSSSESTYELDLQEEPNISLNFKFSDIKNPDTRKSNYSQTFKLPYTQKNNEFFQNWYNVNHSTLVYDTKKKFNAVLFVGSVPQFEGFLQLKGVYNKGEYYDVVLMSNTADLFSAIGEKKLRDVFAEYDDDGTITGYSSELNHEFNKDNMVASWNGNVDGFDNMDGDSLRDSLAKVQKVMYPLSFTKPNAFWDQFTNQYMDMYDPYDTDFYPNTVVDSYPYMVPITQFRPAIQIKELLRLIIVRAGFSYTSSFIDNAPADVSYFGRLFMTTCNHIGAAELPTVESLSSDFSGNMVVGNTGSWGYYDDDIINIGDCQDLDPVVVPANNEVNEDGGCWDYVNDVFTKLHPTQNQMIVRHKTGGAKVGDCDDYEMMFDIYLQGGEFDGDDWIPNDEIVYDELLDVELIENYSYTHTLDLTNIPVGFSCQVLIRPRNIQGQGGGLPRYLQMGASAGFTSEDLESKIQVTWDNYSMGVYGGEVNIPFCIDPTITQKQLLKDLIQRFNLIILTDPDDASNLIIEPYMTYLAQGEIKHWTNKLDTSKEVIVKDTTSLQKKYVRFSDQEDSDLMNKSVKEDLPDSNVWGKIDITVTSNEFAKGELKNEPLFAPYLNEQVYRNNDTSLAPFPTNMAVHYETTYNRTDDGGFEILPPTTTKPKIFYYSGKSTAVKENDTTRTYHLHHQPTGSNSITTHAILEYPICSPYMINPAQTSAYEFTLGTGTKSLHWNANPPLCGDIRCFNYDESEGTWFANTLYGLYWKPYLDNIYSSEARIMECYLNLNEVDIFNFKFNDEIFIKDTYWRILEISNYEVGEKSSTKVTLLKVIDSIQNCDNCNFVVGEVDGNNLYLNSYYYWCPEDEPGCTPLVNGSTLTFTGIFTDPECCECIGGITGQFGTKFYCMADEGSLPLKLQQQFSAKNILGIGSTRGFLASKMGGRTNPLRAGVDTNKFSKSIIPKYGDDIVIKYKVKQKQLPQLKGESHRFVLIGNTDGNTRGYAYPEGTSVSQSLKIPTNTNVILRVKGQSTVIAGNNATYHIGYTEGFAYYTGFRVETSGVTQLGTAGGEVEFQLREGSIVSSCALYIDMSGGVLRFGLDDSQSDTKRIWTLTVDMDVNRIHNMSIGYGEDWAIYQNSNNIQFQTGGFLIWN